MKKLEKKELNERMRACFKILNDFLVTPLKGFCLGVTILIFAYISTYLIDGAETYINELSQLQDVNTLIGQVVVTGGFYFLIFIFIEVLKTLQNTSIEKRWNQNHPSKVRTINASLFILYILTFAAIPLLDVLKIYSENIGIVIMTITFIFISLIGSYIIIRSATMNKTLREINETLEKRNS